MHAAWAAASCPFLYIMREQDSSMSNSLRGAATSASALRPFKNLPKPLKVNSYGLTLPRGCDEHCSRWVLELLFRQH